MGLNHEVETKVIQQSLITSSVSGLLIFPEYHCNNIIILFLRNIYNNITEGFGVAGCLTLSLSTLIPPELQ